MRTIIFDFDGVIHTYTSGWCGIANIPDPPVEGIREEIKRIRDAGYKVVIFSSRCRNQDGVEAILKYISDHNIEVDDVVDNKIPAVLSVDDRAICFDGNPKGLLEKIERFKPWTEGGET